MSKKMRWLFLSLILGCGGGTASTAEPVVAASSGSEPSASSETASSETHVPASSAREAGGSVSSGRVPLDTWYVVSSTSGRGLAVGSGLRFRADGFDVADERQGNSTDGTCTDTTDGLTCDVPGGPLVVVAVNDGTFTVSLGPIALVLGPGPAPAARAAAFDAHLGATNAQRAACRAVAECCTAAENQSGVPCDLEPLLGARTVASCTAGLETLRTRLRERRVDLPESCR